MTRKRMVKIFIAHGKSRNEVNNLARLIRKSGVSYYSFWYENPVYVELESGVVE